MMLPKFPLPILVVAISFTITQVGGSFLDHAGRGADDTIISDRQYHRSLDAAEDCVAATIDLIDPLNNVSGFWFFPNYLALNFKVCNLTTAICDFNNTDYGEQSLKDCNEVGGQIVQKDVRICLSDVDKVTKTPALADLDFVNVEFCLAQSCNTSIPMVQLHQALYDKAEREKAPGTENPYKSLEASSKGLCFPKDTSDGKTASGGFDGLRIISSWIIVGAMTTLLLSNCIWE